MPKMKPCLALGQPYLHWDNCNHVTYLTWEKDWPWSNDIISQNSHKRKCSKHSDDMM